MKRFLCAMVALILLTALALPALAEENLIVNGDFSEMEGELPAGWRREMWLTDPGISVLSVDPDGYEGNSLSVVNVDPNDARYAQTVSVEPNTIYRISGMVWAEGCEEGGYGATLSVGDTFVYSESRYDTGNIYDYVILYGKTGPDQHTLDVYCRVGGYGSEETGAARFDNIEMVKLDKKPADGMVYDFFREDDGDAAADSADSGEPERYTEAWLLFTFIYVCVAVGAIRKRGRSPIPAQGEHRDNRGIWALLGAALLVRLAVAARVPGYHTDINCFTGWSEHMFAVGPVKFYAPDYFCDYPPGYMILLWPVALIRHILGLNTNTAIYRVLLKLLSMLADLAGAWLVWRAAKSRVSDRLALLLAGLYAFNPAAICNSAAWGQIDALLTLLVVLCALSAAEDHYFRALLWFVAALLIKPQALLFAPLGLAAMLAGIFRAEDAEARARRLRAFLLGAAACLGILYATAFVFSVSQAEGIGDALVRPVTWMVELYSGTMQGYRYMTINTLNLHCLLGLNWARMEAHPAAQAVAWALFALSYAYTMALAFIGAKKPRRLMVLGGALIMLISAFGPMMHERYVFPAMLLLALAFCYDRDARLLVSLIALTATLFLNETLVLQGGMTEANFGHLQSGEDWLNYSLSLIVVLNALFTAWTAFDLCARNHVLPLRAAQSETMPAGRYTLGESANYKLNLRRVDYLLMAGITLVYSVVAFVNLGDVKAPQSGWVSERSGESVVFDLGREETFRMTYYGGICNSAFTVQLSNDGETWSDEVFAKYNQGEIFRWIWFVPLDEGQDAIYEGELEPSENGAPQWTLATAREGNPRQTARYVRIEAESAGLNLLEFGFLDDEDRPLPVTIAEADRPAEAERLIDEQDTVAAYPSYLNSTYFDEIYHARTAYEHLHGLNTYEWTHPPLGKVWMMLGVKIFGMTPFGWRFMGALVGVLMLPLMYLLVKQLTKDTRLSAIATGLFALDSMHFTQTRIATIDSYAVFWIMLMYLFMFRYCQMSWNREPLKKTLVPLGLCGVTMGLACATKWIGIYAAAGLAVLFFWTMAVRLRETRYIEGENRTWRNLIITLAFCVAFFIVIPLMIYYFSYYWYLRAEGLSGFFGMFSKRWVDRVIQIQQNMYNYHAGLGGDTHYFRSPWYQWPVIWWPMWYYSGTGYMPDGMISSISCMGNPAVWWFGLAAMLYVFIRACLDRRASRKYVMVIIGFASQFLPWVLVPRSTFIYHYFASVPFIVIASVLLLDAVRRRSPKVFDACACVLLACAAALFVMFYPLESGLPCARTYAQHLRWFKWYNF